jgi:hypothetical protein
MKYAVERAKALSRRVEDYKAELQELYSDDLGGTIPTVEVARDTFESLGSEWSYRERDSNFEAGLPSLDFERLEINLERAAQTIEYYELISHADQESALASHWQEKVNRLLDIQAAYF